MAEILGVVVAVVAVLSFVVTAFDPLSATRVAKVEDIRSRVRGFRQLCGDLEARGWANKSFFQQDPHKTTWDDLHDGAAHAPTARLRSNLSEIDRLWRSAWAMTPTDDIGIYYAGMPPNPEDVHRQRRRERAADEARPCSGRCELALQQLAYIERAPLWRLGHPRNVGGRWPRRAELRRLVGSD